MKTNLPINYMVRKDALSDILSKLPVEPIFFFRFTQGGKSYLKNDILAHFKVSFLLQGEISVTSKEITYHLKPHAMILVPPSILYSIRCESDEPVEFYTIYFDLPPHQKAKFIELFKLQNIVCLPNFIDESSLKLIDAKYDEHIKNMPLAYQGVKILMDNCLWKTLRIIQKGNFKANNEHHHQLSDEKVVLKCVNYLDMHIQDAVTVEDLCSEFAISQSYLYRCFMKHTNSSPKKFIGSYRLKKVEVELIQSSKSIGEIANQYNFSSTYAFCNAFKLRYSQSPKAFRDQFQKK